MPELLWTRGRKKVVNQFTLEQGLWMLAMISILAAVILSLFLIGVLRVD